MMRSIDKFAILRNNNHWEKIMPVNLVFYCEEDGTIPLVEWLDSIVPKARVKLIAKLERLRNLGHELRRPEADYLHDDIYELRVGYLGIQYRALYFFFGKAVVVVSHGLIKKAVVPEKEIDKAIERKLKFIKNPIMHSSGDLT